MTFEEARAKVVCALHSSGGVLYEERFIARLQDPLQDVAFAEFGFDSLLTMEAVMEIEENTGVVIDLGDLVLHSSINALARFVVSKSRNNEPEFDPRP